MNIKQKALHLLAPLIFILGLGVVSLLLPAFASADCGDIKTSVLNCQSGTAAGSDTIWFFVNMTITILTAGVGVLALAGIVYGAVLYTSAGGNAEQVKKAKGIFTNVAIGVIAFAAMYALLNFIIPGGVFN